jgi:excisionase family DNA binding protein
MLAPIERLAYSPTEAAQALGCSRQTIYNRLDDGTLRAVKLGGRTLIPATVLAELLGGGPDDAPAT